VKGMFVFLVNFPNDASDWTAEFACHMHHPLWKSTFTFHVVAKLRSIGMEDFEKICLSSVTFLQNQTEEVHFICLSEESKYSICPH